MVFGQRITDCGLQITTYGLQPINYNLLSKSESQWRKAGLVTLPAEIPFDEEFFKLNPNEHQGTEP
jgi:hypothetical protein